MTGQPAGPFGVETGISRPDTLERHCLDKDVGRHGDDAKQFVPHPTAVDKGDGTAVGMADEDVRRTGGQGCEQLGQFRQRSLVQVVAGAWGEKR